MRLIFGTIALFVSLTSFASDIFTASESDPYLLADFSREKKLLAMLQKEPEAAFNKQFNEMFSQDFDEQQQYETLKTTAVDLWEMQLYEKRRKQLEFASAYGDLKNLSPEFIDLVKTNINYNYWHLLLAYAINRSNENTALKTVTSLPSIMTEAIDPAKINNQERLLSKSYRAFLPFFVVYFNSKEHKFRKYEAGIQNVTDKANYAGKHLSGDVLDYTLTRLLSQYHAMLNPEVFRFWTSQVYSETLRRYLADSYFDKVMEAEANREQELAKATEAKSKENQVVIMDLNDKTFTLDKFKGKVVYVDFWASWCGPCRAEFPNSRKMHESLSDEQKKKIVFLYISIDENLEKWKEAVEKLGLNETGENGHSFDVSAKFLIRTIPRYMIIDQAGKIVNPDAPRPGNPETLNMLLELL